MFVAYAVIGVMLTLLGVIYVYYFGHLLLARCEAYLFLAISESIVTIFIGVFYVSSAIILSQHQKLQNPPTNFTNNTNDIITVNNNYNITEIISTTENANTEISIETEQHNISEEPTTTINFNSIQEHNIETEEVPEMQESDQSNKLFNNKIITVIETTTQMNKKAQYLDQYQQLINDILRKKLSNAYTWNQTYYPTTIHEPINTRTSREIGIDSFSDECFYTNFIENAVILYSFVNCLMSLLNNTLYCKYCIGVISQSSSKNVDQQVDTHRSDTSAPVGPLFSEEKEVGDYSTQPNVELFKAKCTKGIIKEKDLDNLQQTHFSYQKVRLFLQILISWILPALSIVILYFAINKDVPMAIRDLNLMTNLNTTQADPDIPQIMNRKPSAPNQTTEVDMIIKNVYNIVNNMQETIVNKNNNFTPAILDIAHYLNHGKRDRKQIEECTTLEETVKLYFFFVYVVAYFLVILNGKVTQISAKSTNKHIANQLNLSLLSFSLLWLPGVLDLICRIYLTHSNSTMLSDIFLGLGNATRVYSMVSNYNYCKMEIKKKNMIVPSMP